MAMNPKSMTITENRLILTIEAVQVTMEAMAVETILGMETDAATELGRIRVRNARLWLE